MKAPSPQSAGAALAVVTALASLLGLVALHTGVTIGAAPAVLGFAQGYEAKAYEVLTAKQTPGSLDVAAAEARQALAIAPYGNSPRLRLAYIDALQHGRLSPEGSRIFGQSYDLVPLDPDIATWRVAFGLEHWAELSPATRQAIQLEFTTFARFNSRDADMRGVPNTVKNPSGRLAVALWTRNLQNDRRGPRQ
jgi:hypothetical protein